MIRYLTPIFSCLLAGILPAQVYVQLCDPCDLTPLTADQVMTGKKCSLQVYSDANDLWSGGLFLSGSDRQRGILLGRQKDPNSRDWAGSHLEQAGPMAKVYRWEDSEISGFDFFNSEYDCNEGAWFLIDYQALQPGECTIQYYDHAYSWTQADPNVAITIENIPNVDFYVDDMVDQKDFMFFAAHWLEEGCSEPDWCRQTDVDRDGVVDVNDMILFASCWLWGVEQQPAEPPIMSDPPAEPNESQPIPEPNEPQAVMDPNITYIVHDIENHTSITINTGDSIRLYLSKQSPDFNMLSFYVEIYINNPNYGWINNTEYNPSDPNNPDTAEILAWPRDPFYDYYGPGYTQYEGIQFAAASFWSPIEDGTIASFVYTATEPGDVILIPIQYDFSTAQLNPIIIHQVAP